MEHYGIKKFEKFETKKYNKPVSETPRSKDTSMPNKSPDSSKNLSNRKSKESMKSTDNQKRDKDVRRESAFTVQSLKSAASEPTTRLKVDSTQQDSTQIRKLPKLHILKPQDLDQKSLIDFKKPPNKSLIKEKTAFYDYDYAQVEMVQLKSKPGSSRDMTNDKVLSSTVKNDSPIYNLNQARDYSPNKYDYSNILFKEAPKVSKKIDSNFIKQTSFKGLHSADGKLKKKN